MATALITGASGGIGKDLAEIFARNKYDLVLVARSKDKLDTIATDFEQHYGISVTCFEKDLATLTSAQQLYAEVKNSGIAIEVLVNNAGFGLSGETLSMELEKIAEMMQLNMNTLTMLCYLFGQDMKRARQGKILNIASTAAFQSAPYLGIYSATKAYVLNLSEALYIEMKKYGIQVTAACPGPTVTGFTKVAGMENSKLFASNKMSSREVAARCYKALMRGKMTAVIGAKNKLLSMSTRLVPRKLLVMVAARMMQQ
jgi:uncharacterized protein